MTVFRDLISIGSISFNNGIAETSSGCKFFIDNLPGWEDDSEPDPVSSPYTYNDGVAPAENWLYKEKYIEVSGWIEAPSSVALDRGISTLQYVCDPSTEVSLKRHGPVPKAMLVRRSSKVSIGAQVRRDLDSDDIAMFTMTMMAPWPYKTSAEATTSSGGVYGSTDFYRTYDRAYDVGNARYYLPDLTHGGSFEVLVLRENQVRNPGFEIATYGWEALASSSWGLSDDTAVGWPSGLQSAKVTSTEESAFGISLHVSERCIAEEGEPWSARASVYDLTEAASFYISVKFYDADGVFISGGSSANASIVPTETAELVVDGVVAPAGTSRVGVEIKTSTAASGSGSVFYVDRALLSRAVTAGPYFDGGTLSREDEDGNQIVYAWEGAANDSPSQEQKLIPNYDGVLRQQVVFNNEGNALSWPTFSIFGPLVSGEWSLENTATGSSMRFSVEIGSGQTLQVDTLSKTAYIGAEPVGYFLVGEFLSLVPGDNAIRLMVPEDLSSDAHFTMVANSTWR